MSRPQEALVAPRFSAWQTHAIARHVDPYTIWTLATGFRQFVRDGRLPAELDFVVELTDPLQGGRPEPAWPRVPGEARAAYVPDIYRRPMPGPSKAPARHVSVRLPIPPDPLRLDDIASTVLELVLVQGVQRIQIGFPRPALSDERDADQEKPAVIPSCGAPPPDLLLGVLEDSCPFAHRALLDDKGNTRVLALWNQSVACTGDTLPAPQGLPYGQQLLQEDMNRLIDRHRENRSIDEEALYLDQRSTQHRRLRRRSHGAAVLTLMAGHPARYPTHPVASDLQALAPPLDRPQPAEADQASFAPVVAVQFPIEQIGIAGVRWMAVRALDGLRYIAQVSQHEQGAVPLAINLSYGSVAGAHDGSSLLETAMDELAQAHGRMAIVLAAGNAYGALRSQEPDTPSERRPGGHHAKATVAPGQSTALRLYVPPNKPFETYLEVWFSDPERPLEPDQFVEEDDLVIEAWPPAADRPLVLDRLPGMAWLGSTHDDTRAGLIGWQRVAQSRHRSMVLLVVAATQVSTTRVETESGLWQVQIHNKASRTWQVDAWVERDLIAGDPRRQQAARLVQVDQPGNAAAAWLDDGDTLNNIATGSEPFRVGALTATLTPQGDPVISPYSSAPGAPPARGLEFSAIADQSTGVAGLRVSGMGSGTVLRMNGTSVAAPQATRWIGNQLAKGRSVAEIRQQLDCRSPAAPRRGCVTV